MSLCSIRGCIASEIDDSGPVAVTEEKKQRFGHVPFAPWRLGDPPLLEVAEWQLCATATGGVDVSSDRLDDVVIGNVPVIVRCSGRGARGGKFPRAGCVHNLPLQP